MVKSSKILPENQTTQPENPISNNVQTLNDKSHKLNNRQIMFCKEYLVDKNATQAAIRAGYSKKTAFTIGVENLNKPLIAERIRKELDRQSARIDVSADKVIQEICKLAFVNPEDMFDEEGNLKNIKELPRNITACISSIEIETPISRPGVIVKKIRLWDKKGALELLAKHFNLLGDGERKDGDTYITTIIGSFNGSGKGELTQAESSRISQVMGILEENMRTGKPVSVN